MPGGSARTVNAAVALASELSPRTPQLLGEAIRLLDNAAVLSTGRRFHMLTGGEQDRLIERWQTKSVFRIPLALVGSLFKLVHFDDPAIYSALGCAYEKGGPPESAPWQKQVIRGDDWDDDDEIECDVVVVGTGAGGGVVGAELAERGYAVLFLEEGEFHRRDAFTGSLLNAHKRFYRGGASIVSLGNNVMPIFMGRLVGGSTAINTGTCFRTPPWILDDWCERHGSDELSPANMKPHFDRAESILQVAPSPAKYIGAIGEIIARGCDRLGWSHFAVPRNAPDCDGQGVCDFGCPTAARRSTNISYLPPALRRGAMLLTGTRAEQVRIDNGRAVGITARTVTGRKTIQVRARAVVLACGAVPTPMFLLRQGICNRSNQVGRNLSVHPGAPASAIFDEDVAGYNHIPQGYACDQFQREGILLLGAQASINSGALLFPMIGRQFMNVMDSFDRVASFGAMIKDSTQNGRVRLGPRGIPLITYNLTKSDVARLHRGLVHVLEIFRAAGADRYYPAVRSMPLVDGPRGMDAFRTLEPKPSDFTAVSFHPLGTCRPGNDPATSVVDLGHETHDVPSLFIVDGSTVPGPTAVNPQLTIMAMATRAAGTIAERLG